MRIWNGLNTFGFLLAALVLSAAPARRGAGQNVPLDLAIVNGRVMDPESGLDARRNVGIRGDKIVELADKPLEAKQIIDAKGLVVAPGFIDLHEHGQEPRNYQFQAHDGVTTSLELEGGTANVAAWYAQREGKALINYGVSIGHIPVRTEVLTQTPPVVSFEISHTPAAEASAHRAATPVEIKRMQELIDEGFRQGALAEGMGINYTPGASHWEIVEMFRIAAKYHAPVHVHLRYAGMLEPETGLNALEEVIAAAAATGVALHVVHITSMGLRSTSQLLAMVEGAQKRGLDVTTECYPYTAASTFLESTVFDPGWRERMEIDYKDLQWSATGERLTMESFAKYRKQGGTVVIYVIPEDAARAAVSNPMVMIASDGMVITGPKIHPRGQATFSRVLGHYVREEQALDLMTALRKMTLLPAQRLEKRAPMFRDKGRIRIGADADVTVFDPAKIIDKATFELPLQYSDGIYYVFVNGVAVLKTGSLVEGVFPGRPARAPIIQ
jgi:dihydroorotase